MAGDGLKFPRSVPPQVYTPEVLSEGDQIELSVTHEVDFGSVKAWVKYGVTSSVRSGESTDKATERIAQHVDIEIMKRIAESATRVKGN